MELDLNTFSSKELDTLITQAKRRKRVLRKRKSIAVVREKVAELAATEGYTLGELFPATAADSAPPAAAKRATKRGTKRGTKLGAKRGRKAAAATEAAAPAASKRASKRGRSANAGRKVEPKYRNPANSAETWTGRGKPPRWLAAELANGKSKDDFLI